MLPLRLGASSLRVDYDQASRYLQPSFNSNLRKFSFKLRLCSLVYDRLTTAMQCGGMETSLTLSLSLSLPSSLSLSLSLSFVSHRSTSAIWGDGEAEEGRTAPTTVR